MCTNIANFVICEICEISANQLVLLVKINM